jgi:hypothetical protein
MKTTKSKKLIFTVAMILSCAITIGSFNITTTGSKSASSSLETPFLKIGSLSGSTEFYFVPAYDGRQWHIINSYNASLNGKETHNTSSYFFSKDSISVKNNYVGIPDLHQQEMILANSLINIK